MKLITLSLATCLLCLSCKETPKKEALSVTQLPSPSTSPSSVPYLITDESGAVYLSWTEKKSDTSTMKISVLDGDRWSDPVLVTTGNDWFVNWADYPMISKNKEKLAAHYLKRSGDGHVQYDIVLTSSQDQGKTWATPVTIHDDGKKAEHGFVSILPYQDGFFVAWLDGRNTVMEGMENMEGHEGHHGEMSLRAAIFDKDLKKTSEWELDNRTCDCCQTAAALTDRGLVVAYRDRSADEMRDMSIVRLVDGKWTAPKSIHDDNWKIAGCPVNGPRMAARGNNLAIAWYTMANDTARVNVSFSKDGGETFGEPVRLDEGSSIGRVDLILLDDERAMVSWMEGTLIKAVEVSQAGIKGNALTVATSSEARASGFPQMTLAGDRVIFAWTDAGEKNVKTAFVKL